MIKPFLKYHIKDRWMLMQQRRQLKNLTQDPVLVFTMAKVGSLSIYQSIRKYSTIPSFHIHSLDEDEVRAGDQLCFDHGIYPDSRSPVSLINKTVITPQKPYKIISIFRNPLERNISAFFDAFEFHVGMLPSKYKGSIEELKTLFYEKLNHTYAINWYENHFLKGTGVNVYDRPFDTEKQYTVYTHGSIEILLMDSRLVDTEKEKIVQEFCGIPDFKLTNLNVTDQMKHASLYAAFKNELRFDSEYLDQQLNSRFFSHFFTKEDKDVLHEKWLIPLTPEGGTK